jgi:hypothetical protein
MMIEANKSHCQARAMLNFLLFLKANKEMFEQILTRGGNAQLFTFSKSKQRNV